MIRNIADCHPTVWRKLLAEDRALKIGTTKAPSQIFWGRESLATREPSHYAVLLDISSAHATFSLFNSLFTYHMVASAHTPAHANGTDHPIT